MDKKRFAFFGCTTYSKKLLLDLLENGYLPKVIFSIPEYFSISYSDTQIKNINYADLRKVAKEYNIDYYEVDSKDSSRILDYHDKIRTYSLDVILVLGWYYMIPMSIRNLSKLGAWGIHASLLPNYAGGAPLNWAIIEGQKETGVTLFRMDDGVDDGDIIKQETFPITYEDTIKEVYEKAYIASRNILLNTFKDIDNVTYTPQDRSLIRVYPQRTPDDGELKASMSGIEMYNFVRAQSKPYPGAYIKSSDGKKLIIEKARLEK